MIVTFYSYKGGTGRTMALANIAVVLARAGHRVLAVDFDLEAPGLARYFEEITPEPPRTGLIDLLLAESAEPGGPDWRDHVVPIERNLSLLAGGNQDRDYPARVLGFDWGEFFRAGGGEFFERLRADWSAEYDFVLVDSRTGITDTGGVCTITLPDIVVPVFTANHQSVDGVVDVMHRAQAGRQALDYDRPPLVVLPLPARFDGRTERRSAQEWLEIFADRFEPFYQDWLPRGIRPRQILERTKLPYVAYFSFGERLPVRSDDAADPESLGYALHTVAKLIENGLSNAAEVVGLPTEPPAQRVRTDEPRLTVLRRRRRLLPVAHLITSAIALVGTITLLVSQNVALPFRQTIVLAGAAQTGYFDNPEVQRILLRRGFSVRITQAGDRTESPVDLDSAAFVMTTGALSTDALRSQLESAGRSSKSYEPFYSLLVVAGRHEHVAALASAGVATPPGEPPVLQPRRAAVPRPPRPEADVERPRRDARRRPFRGGGNR
ncbi:tyrosine-protein kinase family protein [Saccharothrix espanaensis]|nr:AAA family ATPase [Saccharothrix espanaensis]